VCRPSPSQHRHWYWHRWCFCLLCKNLSLERSCSEPIMSMGRQDVCHTDTSTGTVQHLALALTFATHTHTHTHLLGTGIGTGTDSATNRQTSVNSFGSRCELQSGASIHSRILFAQCQLAAHNGKQLPISFPNSTSRSWTKSSTSLKACTSRPNAGANSARSGSCGIAPSQPTVICHSVARRCPSLLRRATVRERTSSARAPHRCTSLA